jgi:hypothetical protein
VRRLTDRGVVHVQVGPDGADDHLAGVESHADLDGHPVRAEDSLRVLRNRLLHPEGGVAGPDRMIFVGDRCTEEGHDPVAHHLVDGALVAVNGLHHPLENRIEDLARLLRIAVSEELHRALEVREENRHLFALPLKRRLGVDDPLGKVLRRIGLG